MDFDIVIIGGGIIGLAMAARVSNAGYSVVLFEKEGTFGSGTTSRNSEVIHAGIYYERNSLKRQLCIEGRHEIYRLCEENGIPCNKCGKLIVATTQEQHAEVLRLYRKGTENGVEGLELLTGDQVSRLEPKINALSALFSAESGIVDSHKLMAYFGMVAQNNEAVLVKGARVNSLNLLRNHWKVGFSDSDGADSVTARAVINCAGLGAQGVMRMAGLDPDQMGLKLHMCKGEYFSIKPGYARELTHLVYPVPDKNLKSLGIHTVLNLNGYSKLGPSATYVETEEYSVNEANAVLFFESVRGFLPFLKLEDIQPDMAGIRPKLSAEGEPARDFHIAHELENGAEGFFNLVGIDSPGLTASPAIAAYTTNLVTEYLK